jgi:hypothetical protein
MTGLVHNLVHLREWIGQSFYAGAVPNHNHDGSNSAIITATGESLLPAHQSEIHDHFLFQGSAVTNDTWTVTGTITVTASGHFAALQAGEILKSIMAFRPEDVKIKGQWRAKVPPVSTTFDASLGFVGAADSARFTNPSSADKVRCQTVGSGGTQNTDVTVGGNGVDDWHVYKIDLTSTTSTIFSIDGTVVATHSTAVPDADDLFVRCEGGGSINLDYVHTWLTENPVSTA